MKEVMSAIQSGDYAAAYEALQRSSEATSVVGVAIGAFLLALTGRFDEADQLAATSKVPGVDWIARGERQRIARWRDPEAAGGLAVASETEAAPLYAAMAVAFARKDRELADRTKAGLAASARPISGMITFGDAELRPFEDIADADDAIGQMLEAYGQQGLVYFPFDRIKKIEFLPKTNFMDFLMPKARVTEPRGELTVFVPLLYAGSSTGDLDGVRTGRLTMFDHLGSAVRGRGQRDYRVDDAVVGLQSIAAIEFA